MTRHTLDLASLLSGVLFALVGLVLLFGDPGSLSFEWLVPTVAVVLGLLLIWTGRSRRTTDA